VNFVSISLNVLILDPILDHIVFRARVCSDSFAR
jgi:hypothetical protein